MAIAMVTAMARAIARPTNSRMKEMHNQPAVMEMAMVMAAIDRTATATPSNSRTKEWCSKTKQQPHHHAAASRMTVAAAAIMTPSSI